MWSPDSKRIAFVRKNAAVITNSDGTKPQEYPIRDIHSILAWSADNNHLFYIDRSYGIYKATVDFSSIEEIPLLYEFKFPPLISLSLDNKWLAYNYPYRSEQGNVSCNQIRIVNTDSFQDYFVYDYEDVETATTNSSIPPSSSSMWFTSINWMPNNSQLIFTQYVRYGVILHDFEALFTINIDGTGFQQINSEGEVSSPSLQP